MNSQGKKIFSFAEVSKHNNGNDLWSIVHGKVYDLTNFLEDHPGGDDALLSVAGKDASDKFDEVGHSDNAKAIMPEYYIGEVDPSTMPAKAKYIPQKPVHHSFDKSSDFVRLLQFLAPLLIMALAFGIRYCTKST